MRLTRRTKEGKALLKDDTIYLSDVIARCAEYEDLEEQGLLLRLPVEIGTKIYAAVKCLPPNCSLCKAFEWNEGCYIRYKGKIKEREMQYFDIPRIGKTVFLTRTEAEQALAEMEKEK